MINTNIFNKIDATNEDLIKCMSQIEDSDLILCMICPHRPMCMGLSLRKLAQRMNSEEKNLLGDEN